LDQETAKLPLRSSSQAATLYYRSNHSKVEGLRVKQPPYTTGLTTQR